MGCSKSSSKREVYSNTILLQEARKTSKRQLTLHLKQLEKEEKKISRRKEIIKIQAEINEKEMKEIIVKINKMKSWFFEKRQNWQTLSQTHQEKKREESNQ